MPDLTILTAIDGSYLAKRITQTGATWAKQAYDSPRTFDVDTAPVSNIKDLSEVLTALEDLPSSCIIRGRRKAGRPTTGLRRLLHDAPGSPATFEERAVDWVMIDIDDLPAPENLSNEGRLALIVSQLPACFHDVDYHYQWSSSAGINGWDYLRCHLFFWLSAPVKCNTLRQQADAENWLCDLSLFNPVQVHYTAAPVFTNADDPLAGFRSGLVRGSHRSATLPAWSPPAPVWTPSGMVYPASPSFEERLAAIGPDYHMPILKAAASYVAVHKTDTDTTALYNLLHDAILVGMPGKNPKAGYLNARYLNRVISGAVAKFGHATPKITTPARSRLGI